MVSKRLISVAFIFTWVVVSQMDVCDGFAFGSMGGGGCGCGGGGGGCGGGCGGGGGGCGRKKRSVLEMQLRTETSSICPQSEWKRIIDESIRSNAESGSGAAEMAIHSSMIREFDGTKVFVTCATADERSASAVNTIHSSTSLPSFVKFVSNGEAYCSHGDERTWCTVMALMA